MKKIFLCKLFLVSTVFAFGQHDHDSHSKPTMTPVKDSANKPVFISETQKQFSQLLVSYYNLKNALVTGDASTAVSNADESLKMINTVDFKVISEGNSHILVKDLTKISNTKDLEKQRQYFENFSLNMVKVVTALKLNDRPVY